MTGMSLRKLRCLECLTSSELDILSRSMGILKLKPGEIIYRTSDPGDRLYVIRKGTVHELKEGGGRGSIRNADQVVLSKGSSFGEEALLGRGPRSSTMIAGDAPVGGFGERNCSTQVALPNLVLNVWSFTK